MWAAVEHETFDCEKCWAIGRAFCDEKGEWKNSQGPADKPIFKLIPQDILEGLGHPEGLHVCPLSHIPEWFPRLRAYHAAYEKGVLMKPGGLDNQPCTYLTAMDAISNAVGRFLGEKREREAPSGGK